MRIKFVCPKKRSDQETGGLYSILVATLIPDNEIPRVSIADKETRHLYYYS